MTAGHDEFRDTGRLINFAGIGGPLRQTAYPMGQVTRLKLVKRQMYGRAKVDLLRARLVPAG